MHEAYAANCPVYQNKQKRENRGEKLTVQGPNSKVTTVDRVGTKFTQRNVLNIWNKNGRTILNQKTQRQRTEKSPTK